MLLNMVLFSPNKSSTSKYCLNALLRSSAFWPLFWNLLLCCCLLIAVLWRSISFPLCPVTSVALTLSPEASVACLAVLGSCNIAPVVLLALVAPWPQKSANALNHAAFPILTDPVGISKQTLCFSFERPFPSLWIQYPHPVAL